MSSLELEQDSGTDETADTDDTDDTEDDDDTDDLGVTDEDADQRLRVTSLELEIGIEALTDSE